MAESKPFALDGQNPSPQPAGISRLPDGRFARDDATPPKPAEQEDARQQPDRWAPMVGQSSSTRTGQNIPTPPAAMPRMPMKLD